MRELTLKDKKLHHLYLMQMSANETLHELARTNSMHFYGHVLKLGTYLEKGIELKGGRSKEESRALQNSEKKIDDECMKVGQSKKMHFDNKN